MAHDPPPPSWHRTAARSRQRAGTTRPARQSTANIRRYWKAARRSRFCWRRSIPKASFATCGVLTNPRRAFGKMREILLPMLGDIEPRRHPDALVLLDIIEEAHQGCGATGAADDPAVQPDRHHLRLCLAFGIQHVKTVLQIGEELVAPAEALRIDEAHVVGIERI